MKLPIVLRIFKDEDLVDVKQSTSNQVVIGNGGDVDIELKDDSVSPLHAVIEEREKGYFITDLGSQTGTILDGKKVLDSRIDSGTSFLIGHFRIEFYIGVPKPKKPTAPPVVASKVPDEITAVVDTTTSSDELTQELSFDDDELPVDFNSDVELSIKEPDDQSRVVPPKISKPKIPKSVPHQLKDKVSEGKWGGLGVKSRPQTFAPPSAIKDLNSVIKPGVGSGVEVLVAWHERVIETFQCDGKEDVFIGTDPSCNITVPVSFSDSRKYKLISFKEGVIVHVSRDMRGALVTRRGSKPFEDIRVEMASGMRPIDMTLNQGEMLKIEFPVEGISIYVRFVTETAKPILAPLLDMTATEITSLIFAALVGVIFSLYMFVYSPELNGNGRVEEPLRRAVVTFRPPSPPKPPQPVQEKKKEFVKVSDKKKTGQKTPKAQSKTTKAQGKAAEVAPSPVKNKRKVLTSNRPGGAKKISNAKGSGAKSVKPDPLKSGIFSAFGKKGVQDKLSQVFDGAGGVAGMADSATGASGQNEDRPGSGVGTKLKNTGASGAGAKTIGISGVGTKGGRGEGLSGTGSGGFGDRARVNINLGGEEAFFEGSIDKEAVRRVILNNKNAWRHCYNVGLRSDSSLSGKVKISWIITEGGRVRGAKVVSGITPNKAIGNCIVGRLNTLKFPEPPPDKEAIVEYPFLFTSK